MCAFSPARQRRWGGFACRGQRAELHVRHLCSVDLERYSKVMTEKKIPTEPSDEGRLRWVLACVLAPIAPSIAWAVASTQESRWLVTAFGALLAYGLLAPPLWVTAIAWRASRRTAMVGTAIGALNFCAASVVSAWFFFSGSRGHNPDGSEPSFIEFFQREAKDVAWFGLAAVGAWWLALGLDWWFQRSGARQAR